MGILVNKPAGEEGAAWPAICIGMFVAFGGVLFGYDTGTIGGILAMPYWQVCCSLDCSHATCEKQ